MSFENRNGKTYYYRKERVGNKVVSKYIGTGELSELFAGLDRGRRIEKARDELKRLRERSPEEELDEDLSELEADLQNLIARFLISKGFYKTKSREWRFKLYE